MKNIPHKTISIYTLVEKVKALLQKRQELAHVVTRYSSHRQTKIFTLLRRPQNQQINQEDHLPGDTGILKRFPAINRREADEYQKEAQAKTNQRENRDPGYCQNYFLVLLL